MQRRYNLAHFILAIVVVLGLALLMVVVDAQAQAQIVFMSDRVWDDLQWEIYMMDTDEGNLRNLTNHPFKDWEPSWSPDGRRIVFVSDREADANPDIYVMNADGSHPQNLTNHPEDDLAPAWFGPAFAVVPAGKKFTIWGRLKGLNR